jgi:hypothetical protein
VTFNKLKPREPHHGNGYEQWARMIVCHPGPIHLLMRETAHYAGSAVKITQPSNLGAIEAQRLMPHGCERANREHH